MTKYKAKLNRNSLATRKNRNPSNKSIKIEKQNPKSLKNHKNKVNSMLK